jgi:hypothetical protein
MLIDSLFNDACITAKLHSVYSVAANDSYDNANLSDQSTMVELCWNGLVWIILPETLIFVRFALN